MPTLPETSVGSVHAVRVDRAELARVSLGGYSHGPTASTDGTNVALAKTPDPVAMGAIGPDHDTRRSHRLADPRVDDLVVDQPHVEVSALGHPAGNTVGPHDQCPDVVAWARRRHSCQAVNTRDR